MDRHVEHEPLQLPVRRHERDAVLDRVARTAVTSPGGPPTSTVPSVGTEPEQRLQELAPPRADETRQADDLAGRHVEAHVLKRTGERQSAHA